MLPNAHLMIIHKYLLSVTVVTSTVLGSRHTVGNKIDKVLALKQLTFECKETEQTHFYG